MAILIYPGGATVVREPSNGCYFTRAEKEQMVPGGDMVTFLTDDGTVVSTQRVLKGQTTNIPTYLNEEGYAVKWSLDAATPITENVAVHIVHDTNE